MNEKGANKVVVVVVVVVVVAKYFLPPSSRTETKWSTRFAPATESYVFGRNFYLASVIYSVLLILTMAVS